MNHSLFSSIILGIVQGITEFIPVSSSGHLVLFQSFLLPGGKNVFFDVILHCATLCATVIVFWKPISNILAGCIHPSSENGKQAFHFIVILLAGLIPTAIIGAVFKHPLEKLFESPFKVSMALLVTGILLFFTRYAKEKENQNIKLGQAFLIGVIQGIAIIPGISRSGSTIAAALFLGISRPSAGEFSFLLSIPSILGALALKLHDIQDVPLQIPMLSMVAGFICAFIIGIVALKILLRFIQNGKLHYFAYYCWLIGIFGMVKFWQG